MKNNKLFCFIGLVVLVFASFSLSSCRDLFHSPPDVLQIGDTGPGGGIIFFAEGGSYKECSGELGTYTWNDAIIAAQNHRGGNFTDWHLPDRGELSLMYQNLAYNNLGGFFNDSYWSSVESNNPSLAWEVHFRYGYEDTASKTNSYRVRAVRAF